MVKKINRRELLRLGAVAAASSLGVVACFEVRAGKEIFSHWRLPWLEAPGFFTREQLIALERLTSVIVPADERSGGAKEAKAVDFIALVIGSSHEGTKKIWRDGLEASGRLARSKYSMELSDLGLDPQTELLSELSRIDQQSALGQFYRELKSKTVHAYYTSKVGLRDDLRYLGNTETSEFVGCDHPQHSGKG